MGRKKKYTTKESRRQAVCDRSMKYYLKNKEDIKEKNLRRYYENKRNIQDNQ